MKPHANGEPNRRRVAVVSGLKRRVQSLLRSSIAPAMVLTPKTRMTMYRWAGLDVGQDTRIEGGLFLTNERVSIGERCFVNARCHFDPGDATIRIGDDVNIGAGVILAAATHHIGTRERRALGTISKPIVIGRGTWIGAGAVILQGVVIAEGCVIGAGAVVSRDTAPDGVYRGIPAVRTRDLPARDGSS